MSLLIFHHRDITMEKGETTEEEKKICANKGFSASHTLRPGPFLGGEVGRPTTGFQGNVLLFLLPTPRSVVRAE